MITSAAASAKPAASHLARVRKWHRLDWTLPWLVLAISLVATYSMWQSEQQNALVDLQIDFDFRVREVDARLDQRMKAYEQILRGVRGLFAASGNVTRNEFRDYIDSLHLGDNYSGSSGIGFLKIVAAAQKDKRAAAIRKAALPANIIKLEGERDIYLSDSYFVSFVDDKLPVFGHNMPAHSVHRAAMDLARDSGQAVNSGKVLLPRNAGEDKRIQPGFLMYLPVYKNGAPHATLAERRANIIGWIYAPFRMIDMMTGIVGEIASDIDIEIHDGEGISDATMLYDPDLSGAGGNPNAQFKSNSRIQVANHYWTVAIGSLYGFEIRADEGKQVLVAYSGAGASLLLALLTWLLVRGRALAVRAHEEINQELTERKRAEEGLRLASTVVKTVEEAVMVTDADNLIIAVNPAFTAITGYPSDEAIGKNPNMLSSGKHSKEFFDELRETLLATGSWRGEIWNRRKNGEFHILWMSVKLIRDENDKLTHHVAVFSDITERKAAEERMQRLARYDLLTDLPNRSLFTDRLRQALVLAKRDKAHMALMFLDLDNFKPINDQFGHAVGDLLLKEVAKRLQQCVRESDTVSRMGGDEFVVLLPAIEAEHDVMLVAEKMLHALRQPFDLAGQSLHISVSIGVAVYPEHGGDERMLTKNADIAMYCAKDSGRNNVKLYHPDMLVKRDGGGA